MSENKMKMEIEPLTFLRLIGPVLPNENYRTMLNHLLVAEAIMARDDDEAKRHFLALVEYLKEAYHFSFEELTLEEIQELKDKQKSDTPF